MTRKLTEGATLIEYVLLLALIALVCVIALTFLGNNASTKLGHVFTNAPATTTTTVDGHGHGEGNGNG